VSDLEHILAKVKEAADVAGKKTGEFVEISKLKIEAADIENKIEKKYAQIGKIVYEAASERTDCTMSVHDKAAEIDELKDKLAKLREQIKEIKNRE
jgi:uncharacterized coiled-coil DUF342 family protein